MRSLIFILFALAACSPETPAPEAIEATGQPPQALEQKLPAEAAARRYVGRWASADAGCDGPSQPAWRFEAERLVTVGEVACDFLDIDETQTGYRVSAACTSEGASAPTTLELSFAENAGAMQIAGGPWSTPIALVHCGALD